MRSYASHSMLACTVLLGLLSCSNAQKPTDVEAVAYMVVSVFSSFKLLVIYFASLLGVFYFHFAKKKLYYYGTIAMFFLLNAQQ